MLPSLSPFPGQASEDCTCHTRVQCGRSVAERQCHFSASVRIAPMRFASTVGPIWKGMSRAALKDQRATLEFVEKT